MRPSRIILAAIAMLAPSAVNAFTEPHGTPLTMSVSHTGPFGETLNFTHVFGGQSIVVNSFGFPFLVTSDNSLHFTNIITIDFSGFNYASWFAGQTGSFTIDGLVQPVFASVMLDEGFGFIGQAQHDFGGDAISGSWAVNDVLAAGTTMHIIWNYEPAPGGAALLGIGAIAALRRRR